MSNKIWVLTYTIGTNEGRKLDALSWAVYNKQKAERAA